MYHIGIRPESFAVICCKGVNSPIAAYEPMTPGAANGGIIFSNTPGVTTAMLETFDYKRRVALYPFEQDLEYEVEVECVYMTSAAASVAWAACSLMVVGVATGSWQRLWHGSDGRSSGVECAMQAFCVPLTRHALAPIGIAARAGLRGCPPPRASAPAGSRGSASRSAR